MSGRLGIDFGTSNTVLALWDETRREGLPVHVPDFGHPYQYRNEPVSIIPSLIHYAPDGRRWVGEQVREKKLASSERTFSLIKRYVANRSPVNRRLDGRQISHWQAGQDFLSAVLLFAAEDLQLRNEEVALTVPVEAFEHYVDWLTGVAEAAGFPRFRLIDEPAAAALGYGAHIQPGNVYLIFDFGGGTLDVAVALIEEQEQLESGRRCRILGKAGTEIGGSSLDTWLFQEFLRQNNRQDTSDDIRRISSELLSECRAAKEQLSFHERAEVRVANPHTGAALAAEFTRNQFDDLLDRHETFAQIDRTIRRALNSARDRGYAEDHIKSVLMVGGSSLIPSVQKTVQRIFGKEKVMLERPLDAVARGAAAFVAGVDFYDHIQHDYAIRWVNPQKGDYDYRVLVKCGAHYPTQEALARMTVKATHPGQTELGIAIFEMGQRAERNNGECVELVFDPSGAARVMQVAPDEQERRSLFWVNEQSPTFLQANPPAQPGEARFAVEFGIDAYKRLIITARDLKSGQVTHRDYPVVKLT
ncbi:MAG: Hsp70 family protein [Verrucomicrobia bacterium]|nr:Hsp70 family protein [Verrucomicrobiota bacterium]